MKYFSILALFLIIVSLPLFGQEERCASHRVLMQQLVEDPSLGDRLRKSEKEIEAWILQNGAGHSYSAYEELSEGVRKQSCASTICTYNNTIHATIAAPDTIGQVVSPTVNCVSGGKYVRVTGMLSGRIYRISTCSNSNFDTQLTIFRAGGTGGTQAYNDDFCGNRSEIIFNPLTNDNFDILVDQAGCTSNTLCAGLEVELLYTPRAVIVIPVVFHIIHKGEAIGVGTNISQTQILSQINVLNQDFRRLNSGINTTPAAFRGISDDPLIEFCLANQDTAGNSTTGIIRYNKTSPQSISQIDNTIKPTTIWDPTRYLNIWSVQFGSPDVGTLGYATFPSNGTATTDGMVLSYTALGNTGAVQTPYHLGKTASHEVGHWLGLYHIWGDDFTGSCLGSDTVEDTPNQADPTFGTATFPKCDNCSQNYPGIMFYNFMDYSNDIQLTMFTRGQCLRMDAVLATQRPTFLNPPSCAPVGIKEENRKQGIQVFPNPSDGTFKINFMGQSPTGVIRMFLIDALGKRVWSDSGLYQEELSLQITGVSPGIYILKIESALLEYNTRVVIK